MASGPQTEPVAIIGGSVVAALAGRIRRPHIVADVERPTMELSRAVPAAQPADSARRPGRRVLVLAVVAAGLACAVSGGLYAARSQPVQRIGPVAAPAPAVVLEQPSPPARPDPRRDRNYLAALRSAGVPASRGGPAEIEAAMAICEQLDRGVPAAELTRTVPALLKGIDSRQRATVVDLARRHYCP